MGVAMFAFLLLRVACRAKWSVCLGGLVSLLVVAGVGFSIHSERATFPHSNYCTSLHGRHARTQKQMTSACGTASESSCWSTARSFDAQ